MTTAREILIGECECGTCGATYDFERDLADFSDQCPGCAAAEQLAADAAEAREEAIADAQGDVDEAESDPESLEAELAELRGRIAEAKSAVRAARRKLAAVA